MLCHSRALTDVFLTRLYIHKESEAPPVQTFGEEIHTNVWGPSPNLSLGKRRYYLTFTDDYSQFTKVEILHSKDETFVVVGCAVA